MTGRHPQDTAWWTRLLPRAVVTQVLNRVTVECVRDDETTSDVPFDAVYARWLKPHECAFRFTNGRLDPQQPRHAVREL